MTSKLLKEAKDEVKNIEKQREATEAQIKALRIDMKAKQTELINLQGKGVHAIIKNLPLDEVEINLLLLPLRIELTEGAIQRLKENLKSLEVSLSNAKSEQRVLMNNPYNQ